MICASCGAPMDRNRSQGGAFWMCRGCAARMGTLAYLQKSLDRGPLQRLWQDARSGQGRQGRPCPSCRRAMREVSVLITADESSHGEPALLDLDLCISCHVVFFDADEIEQMPLQPVVLAPRGPRPPPPSQRPAPPAAARGAIDAELAYKLDRIEREARQDVSYPPSGLKYLLAWWVPVEVNAPPLRRMPLVTWVSAALIVLVGLATFGNPGPAIQGWAFVPSDPFRHGGLTLLTSFFLHGGLFHLLGNLWFLLTFGDNVEDFLGHARYAAVLAASALAGLILHTLADPGSSVPLVGASGGISGVMILYALRFPQARLGLVFYFQWVALPAWLYMAFWVGMQLLGSFATLGPTGGGVAYLAHLGGALAGGFAYWTWGRRL
jgi:membrane associated rhomboid family serine protease